MEPLHPSMLIPQEAFGWDAQRGHRIPACEPKGSGYWTSKVENWLARLLRVPDNEPEFKQLVYQKEKAYHREENQEEARLVLNGKLHCVVDPQTKLTWLYSSVGEKVCYPRWPLQHRVR